MNNIDTSNMSPEIQAQIAALQARAAQAEQEAAKAKEKLTAKRLARFSIKTSEKTGAVSVYHGSRFPVTLYAQQWEFVLQHKDEILAYISANPSLPRKDA